MNEILTQEQYLIDRSVKYINEEWERGLDSWFNIGEYVLVNFFDNKPEKASSKAWNKGHSFYKLCNHPELKMSPRSLSNCVRIVVQDKIFLTAQPVAQSLPKTHKILLLPVPDEDKIETANEITGMTKREAEAWIKQKYQSETSWLRYYDVWNFAERLDGFGERREAQCPPQVILNFIYYFTNEDDLIVDPMAGGGATTDCAKHLNRRSLCYDIVPLPEKDVKYNNIRDGYPEETIGCDAIFIDPPYYTQKAEAFVEDATFQSLDDFWSFWEKLFVDSYQVLRPEGKIGVLMPNQCHIDLDNKPFLDLPIFTYRLLEKAGFIPFRRIFVPLTVVQYKEYDLARAKKNKTLLALWRELLIFEKTKGGLQ